MPDPNKGSPVIDMDELNEIMDNDMELIQDCFAGFLSELPGNLADIQDAIVQKKFEQMDRSAHKLKGSLKYLAAETAATAAMAIELAGRHQDLDNLNEKFSTLEKECQNIMTFIEGFTP